MDKTIAKQIANIPAGHTVKELKAALEVINDTPFAAYHVSDDKTKLYYTIVRMTYKHNYYAVVEPDNDDFVIVDYHTW